MSISSKKSKIPLVILVIVFIAITIGAVPVIRYMMQPDFQTMLSQWVDSAGIWGVALLFLLHLLHVVVAFIPGEPIELVSGAMYGTFGGLAISILGVLTGSAIIFYVVRKLGQGWVRRSSFYPKLQQYEFLKNEEKLEKMVFLLYFIPGTPKDFLVYVCALTDISIGRFLTVATFARIPSIVTSTMAGASFMAGNHLLTVLIFIITAIAGAIGIRYHNKRFGSKTKES